jgi:hypothetical protein
MKRARIFFGALVIAVTLGFALASCAAKRAQQAVNTERMLHVAGFQLKIADTPEKLEMLKGMPQRRITPYPRGDKIFYVYADATSCRCMYVGTPEAYQRYIEFQVGQGIAEDNRKAAQANAAAQTPVNWGVWGVWGPWW